MWTTSVILMVIENILLDAGCAALCAYIAARRGFPFWVFFWPSLVLFYFISPLLVVFGLVAALLVRIERPVRDARHFRRTGEIRCGACDKYRKQDGAECLHCGAVSGYQPPIAIGEAPAFLSARRTGGNQG